VLRAFREESQGDPIAILGVEIALVGTSEKGVQVNGFTALAEFTAPALSEGGKCAPVEAVIRALDLLTAGTGEYRNQGVTYFRPWMIL
jgi:uncharacterized protein YegL